MIPLPYPVGPRRHVTDREHNAWARTRRRQRRRWHRAWCRAGMPGYWEDYEQKRFSEYLMRSTR